MSSLQLRSAAAVLLLVLLAALGLRVLPPYLDNLVLQRFIERAVADVELRSGPPEILKTKVVDEAGRIGAPVRLDQVEVTRHGSGGRVQVLYVVRVDIGVYTVDLHFRPGASW